MGLALQPYPGPLDGLAESLDASLRSLDDTQDLAAGLAGRELEAVGPLPVYSIDPDEVERAAEEPGLFAAQRTGWRALVTDGGEPLSVSEVSFTMDGTELFEIRGREAAKAFFATLRLSLEFAEDPTPYEVRWLAVPDVYVSALWLRSRRSLFIPSRLGSADRPEPRVTPWPELRQTILRLIEQARRQPDVPGDGDDTGSPRSGLPPRRG